MASNKKDSGMTTSSQTSSTSLKSDRKGQKEMQSMKQQGNTSPKMAPNVKFTKSESMQMEYWKLEENIENLKRMITSGKNKGYNTYNLEVECSYLEHEKFIRDTL